MADKPVFLYAAVYDGIDATEADHEAVFDVHAAGAIGTCRISPLRGDAERLQGHIRSLRQQHH